MLGEAPGDAVLEPQQPLDALLRGDVAADAAIAGKVAFRVEHRLAGGEHVTAAAIHALAAHPHGAGGRGRLLARAPVGPAPLALAAGFPARRALCRVRGSLL